MNRSFSFLCCAFILLFFSTASHLKAPAQFSHYAVYAQTFSETQIVDGQATSTRSQAKYLTLVEFNGTTSTRSFRTWQLNGKNKAYSLIDDDDVVSTCATLNQGSKKILVSYWDSLPTGRHFSWSTGQLKSYTIAGQSVLLPAIIQTRGVGVPKDSDLSLKEYSVVGVLDLPATQYVSAQNPADDAQAGAALQAYYISKGFRFN
jgi:hypothetical protein